jgi:hypothetical protein
MNIDVGLVSHLRSSMEDVVYLADIAPAASDIEVTMRAQAEVEIVDYHKG